MADNNSPAIQMRLAGGDIPPQNVGSSTQPVLLKREHTLPASPADDAFGNSAESASSSPTLAFPRQYEDSDSTGPAKNVSITVESLDNVSPVFETTRNPILRPGSPSWRLSIIRAGPIFGILAPWLSFAQIFACYGILKASDGTPFKDWQFQPSVYLAIFSALSNRALGFAVVQGTAVTFWLRALKGTSLAQLHCDWAYGLHVYKAMLAMKHFNVLALSCICATFVAIDYPLLQRATLVRSSVVQSAIQLEVLMTPEIPSYFTGAAMYAAKSEGEGMVAGYSGDFHFIAQGFAKGLPIPADGLRGCPGICKATIQAPALAVDSCTTELEHRDYLKPLLDEDNEVAKYSLPPHDRYTFGINWVSQMSK